MDRLLTYRSRTVGAGSANTINIVGRKLGLTHSSTRSFHFSASLASALGSTSHHSMGSLSTSTRSISCSNGSGGNLHVVSRRFRGSLNARLIQTNPLEKDVATSEPTGSGQHSVAFGVFKTFAYFILFDIVQWVVLSVYIWFTRPISTIDSPPESQTSAGASDATAKTANGSTSANKTTKPVPLGKKGATSEPCGSVADRKAAFVYSWIAFAGGPERFHWILEPLPTVDLDDRAKGKLAPTGAKSGTPATAFDTNADIELKRSLVRFFSLGGKPGLVNFAECIILAGAVVDRFGWYITLPVVVAYRPWRPKVVKKIAQTSALGY